MKGTRALSFLLALVMLASLVIPGSFVLPAKADTDNGMRISKTATKNTDGTYTITLEAYATGSKIISEVKTDIPTDIVLVLDQSGSMENSMKTYDFRPYTGKTNSDYYGLRHNGGSANLYYQLSDGGYATVSVVGSQISSPEDYTPYLEGTTNRQYYQNGDNLYFYNNANGEYEPVSVEYSINWNGEVYTYSLLDGNEFFKASGWGASNRSPGNFDGRGPLYYLSTTPEYSYTYSYTDANGKTQVIGTSVGASTIPEGFTLHEYYESGTTQRIAALQSAVTTFANSVAKKAAGADGTLGTDDDVNHRIAVVGFACSNTGSNGYNNYQNTELFIGSNQYKYGTAAQGQYGNAFQSMNTRAGQANVTASINALEADGATYVNLGVEIANGIFNANPVPEGKRRNRVVVVFTDGVPGYSSFEDGVADDAVSKANTARSYGATVYAVGIFEGADATSAGSANGTDTQKANRFMQRLSDNLGNPQTPSYYLSASDAGTLSSIFQQISNQIENGGSSTTLTDETVIKDIVAPQFTLPENASAADITLNTYDYIGENQWSETSGGTMGATATVNGSQVSVTGFDFSKNWCGTVNDNGTTEYRGSKLVISFKVEVKEGFLGGNGVYTNASAGVYENSEATDPIMTFDRPQVDIAINDVTVDAQDKNVYLLQDVSAETLKSGAGVTVGGVSLDLGAENYGLEPWQNAYVNIDVVITDKNGDQIPATGLTDLKEDNSYTVSVTVSPTTDGTATTQSGNGTGAINVFKPVLTYQDSDVYYGDTVPTDFSGNLVSTVWKHGNTQDSDVTMVDKAPTLTTTNTPDSSKIKDGKINTKQDVPVNVSVKIGEVDVADYVTFQHQACTDRTDTLPTDSEFLLHVKTCTLTIKKTGGDSSEPYVFIVKKGSDKYTEASITGNGSVIIYELPVGTYTIEEDTGWSWRYPSPIYTGNGVTLDATNANGEIICTNTSNENKWLNGFSAVVKNIFGVSHSN